MFGALLGGAIAAAGSMFGSSKAADAASDSAEAQLAMQREMFDRSDELSGDARRRNRKTINQGYGRNMADANATQLAQMGLATGVADQATGRANTTFRRSMRDQRHAERKSIQPFQVQSKLGNTALRAFAENLGVGNLGGYKLSMTPGSRFLMDEMSDSVQGSAAGAGGLFSGATMAALQDRASGIAATDRDNQQGQLFNLGQLGQNAAGTMANLRTSGSSTRNALRGDFRDTMYGIGSDWASRMGGAMDAGTNRRTNATDFRTGNLGSNEWNRVTAMQGAANQYANGASDAYDQQGQAGMIGAMGIGNALRSGMGAYGYMGGQLPWMGGQAPLQPQPATFGTGGQGALY
jgi:hypothetical protein